MLYCFGVSPELNPGWSHRLSDQLPNLGLEEFDLSQIVAVQASSQRHGLADLQVIERELKGQRLASSAMAVKFQRPENLATFLVLCPSGHLFFLDKYSCDQGDFGLVCLFIQDGVLCCGLQAYCVDNIAFGPGDYFAVIDPAAQPTR